MTLTCSITTTPSSARNSLSFLACKSHSLLNPTRSLTIQLSFQSSRLQFSMKAARTMKSEQSETVTSGVIPSMKLLFVEMGVGYDQHGQDITAAAMRACRDAISSNSIPAFRRGSIPGVSFEQMKLQIKLGVPQPLQQFLDIERVKSVFPYGEIVNFEVVDGGLICSSGVYVEEMGDKNDDCYVVNAAVYSFRCFIGFVLLLLTLYLYNVFRVFLFSSRLHLYYIVFFFFDENIT